MFENKLKSDLEKIFLVEATYDQPSEKREQGKLFITLDDSHNTIREGEQIARAYGSAVIFGTNDKIPFGFFSKAIQNADRTITKNFFFHEFESNTKTFQNLVQRGFSFVYFFHGQYDPDQGSITTIEFQGGANE